MLQMKALPRGGQEGRMTKSERKQLKELKKRDKANPDSLNREEILEFTELLNKHTDELNKSTKMLQKVALVVVSLAVLLEIVSAVLTILTALK